MVDYPSTHFCLLLLLDTEGGYSRWKTRLALRDATRFSGNTIVYSIDRSAIKPKIIRLFDNTVEFFEDTMRFFEDTVRFFEDTMRFFEDTMRFFEEYKRVRSVHKEFCVNIK